jgi:hypothetical protein
MRETLLGNRCGGGLSHNTVTIGTTAQQRYRKYLKRPIVDVASRSDPSKLPFSLRLGTKRHHRRDVASRARRTWSQASLHVAQESVTPTLSPVALRVEATLLP